MQFHKNRKVLLYTVEHQPAGNHYHTGNSTADRTDQCGESRHFAGIDKVDEYRNEKSDCQRKTDNRQYSEKEERTVFTQ